MICDFWKSLKLFIKVEMEQQDCESMNFEEMVQRAVNAEAKAGLKSSTMVRNLDARCPSGHRLSHNISYKVQTQGFSYKDSLHSEKSKNKYQKPAAPRGNAAKPANKKDNKKRLQWRRREQNKQIPATGNTTKASKKKKKRRNSSKITYFNCNKKGNFASNCLKPSKN